MVAAIVGSEGEQEQAIWKNCSAISAEVRKRKG
jgi:hypothetical protein